MSFLKDGINGNDGDDPDADAEENYKRLMPKIGRDFVTREDLQEALESMMRLVDPLGLSPVQVSDTHARSLADKYVALVQKGKDGNEQKRDLATVEEPKEKDKKNKEF